MAETLDSVAFAALIKEKYPQYADIPDEELTASVLAKHPQYRDMVFDQGAADAEVKRQQRPLSGAEMASGMMGGGQALPQGVEPGPGAGVGALGLTGVGALAAPGAAAGIAGGLAADYGMQKAGVPPWMAQLISLAVTGGMSGIGKGLIKKALGKALATGATEAAGEGAVEAAAPALSAAAQKQLAKAAAKKAAEDTAPKTIEGILANGKQGSSIAEAFLKTSSKVGTDLPNLGEAALAGAAKSGGNTLLQAAKSASPNAKVGQKIWMLLKDGKFVKTLTPDQARAAEAAGETVTWVKNLGG